MAIGLFDHHTGDRDVWTVGANFLTVSNMVCDPGDSLGPLWVDSGWSDQVAQTTGISLNLPIDLGFLQLLPKAFFVYSGTTAVTSISTFARSSTRSATCTSVMAG